ncbi:zinc finger Ran-binding domain-containing protein 2 [Ananas comosus]|uniref:Zinc finger Ran-binding domain-containing protein 2 n=2 Tax=Ananas comosus TaxID=4615 RepID=A0A6P5EXX8_ANACO|nr:zinc finger Ran-binding domain-containing protein 2 [Ananas comosus]XP_020088687.1 zinc finger Ran-binding domain-containing protein 2 [Ananas comosus]XP_020088688.1 zinc finger Ran-binding domain-containing protein 2 [Ananas comosus]
MGAGSISPPRRGRFDDAQYGPDYDDPVGPRYVRGFNSGRGGGRFRDVSPNYGFGRGGRSSGRGYAGRGLQPSEGEYVHRNDPNLSPREGDWICQNPTCGNLNFARRTHCNNCNKYRYGPELCRSSRSPRRGYTNSPPPHGPLPRAFVPPLIERDPRRGMERYRSPARGWAIDDPRDFPARQRERLYYREELDYNRDRASFDWSVSDEWDRARDRGRESRDQFLTDRRGYDQRSPSPRGHWGRNLRGERSRSPTGDRALKGSFIGRGRDDRDYADSYVSRARAHHLDGGPGRSGYRQGSDPFPGQGRGERRAMGRGRNADNY